MQVVWAIGERAHIGNADVEQVPGIGCRISDPAADGLARFNQHGVCPAAHAPREVKRRQRACRSAPDYCYAHRRKPYCCLAGLNAVNLRREANCAFGLVSSYNVALGSAVSDRVLIACWSVSAIDPADQMNSSYIELIDKINPQVPASLGERVNSTEAV
jgi:hypothetical protein